MWNSVEPLHPPALECNTGIGRVDTDNYMILHELITDSITIDK